MPVFETSLLNMNIYLIGILTMAASWLVRWRFQSVMKNLSGIGLPSGISGKEVAERMLAHYGITDVQVVSVGGMLTDHYNPANKTVNLSEGVFNNRSIAAAAIAAHECGHAVQHATHYAFLKFRSGIVPIVSITSRFSPWVLLGGILLLNTFPALLFIGIAMLAVSTFFSFITLPVEFDASSRALAWLDETGVATGEAHESAKKGLTWAAMTYVVAALGSLATLLYYVAIFNRRR